MIPLLAQTTTDVEPLAVQIPDVEWSLLAPFIILAVAGVLLVTVTSVVPSLRTGRFPAIYTGLTAVLALVSVRSIWSEVEGGTATKLVVAEALGIDAFSVFATGVICLVVFLVSFVLPNHMANQASDGPEWYVLLLMSASGGILLVSAEDLIVTFLGLEILSIALYLLASLNVRDANSLEAGFKYLILGALSSAVFLYGIALTYGATGSTSLRAIAATGGLAAVGDANPDTNSSMILVAMALILVGFGFKVAAVPFHSWAPDVYQGAPSPVVAFMASAVKVAAFAGLIRVFWVAFGWYVQDWRPMIAGFAALTLLVGSLLAIAQTNVKRMLAYSSMIHAGFILVGVFVASTPVSVRGAANEGQPLGIDVVGGKSVLFYMLSYSIAVIGTFAVVTLVGGKDDANHELANYRGLARRAPVLAGLMSILLFSQAGVPFTAGFVAKFQTIFAAGAAEAYVLAAVAMLSAALAAVLYLRIVVSMFMAESEDPDPDSESIYQPTRPNYAIMTGIVVAAGTTVLLGVWPSLVDDVVLEAAESMSRLLPVLVSDSRP